MDSPVANEPVTTLQNEESLFSAVEEGLAAARREIMTEYSSPENLPEPETSPVDPHLGTTSSQGPDSAAAPEINGRLGGPSGHVENMGEGEEALEEDRMTPTESSKDGDSIGEDVSTVTRPPMD